MLFLNFLLSMSMCMVGEHYEGVAYSLTRIDERARFKGISDSTSWRGIGLTKEIISILRAPKLKAASDVQSS